MISSRAGDHVEDGSTREAILGREVVLLNFELFDGINRRLVRHCLKSAVLLKIRDGGAIDQHVSGGVPAAVGIKVDSPTGTGHVRFRNSRCKKSQTNEIPAIER